MEAAQSLYQLQFPQNAFRRHLSYTRLNHVVESQPVLPQLQHKYHITFSSLTKIELFASAWSGSSLHLCVISWSSNLAVVFRKPWSQNREDSGFRILDNTPAFSFKIFLHPTTTQAQYVVVVSLVTNKFAIMNTNTTLFLQLQLPTHPRQAYLKHWRNICMQTHFYFHNSHFKKEFARTENNKCPESSCIQGFLLKGKNKESLKLCENHLPLWQRSGNVCKTVLDKSHCIYKLAKGLLFGLVSGLHQLQYCSRATSKSSSGKNKKPSRCQSILGSPNPNKITWTYIKLP